MEKRSYDYLEFFTVVELQAKKSSFYQISELYQWMNIHQRPHYMCIVMGAVEGKHKASHSDLFLGRFKQNHSDFLTLESGRSGFLALKLKRMKDT